MIWRHIKTGANTGSFNMDFDLNLVKEAEPDAVILRLYRWSPYCISLGANQSFHEVIKRKAEADGIEIVKRPTGGRAILHSEELTYSIVMPLTIGYSPRQMYQSINAALIQGLKFYNPVLTELELEEIQPNLVSFYKEDSSAACFTVPAKSEIKYEGKKLVGSAQRKIGDILLQHGSIMCGEFHVNLADYLNLGENEIKKVRDNLVHKTTDLKAILNYEIDYTFLEESIVEGFEKYFKVRMLRDELTLK